MGLMIIAIVCIIGAFIVVTKVRTLKNNENKDEHDPATFEPTVETQEGEQQKEEEQQEKEQEVEQV